MGDPPPAPPFREGSNVRRHPTHKASDDTMRRALASVALAEEGGMSYERSTIYNTASS